MVRWLLFETWLGDRLLALLERWTGLAIVPVGELADTWADLTTPERRR